MADVKPQFTVVDDEPEAAARPPRDTAMLMMALRALSQRAVAAIADLFMLATVGLVFWITNAISAAPSNAQITTLGVFATFVLIANFIVRKF
jgi:ABC-type siderophore export system fused ATPase/permease subunit